MYTIYLDNNNTLTVSKRQRIMQRSKLIDSMHFLVPKMYGEYDMSTFTCSWEFLLPVSKKYKSEVLTCSEEMYNEEYLEYLVPMDTSLTSEAGNIEVQLTFTYVDLDEDGNSIQLVRKTNTAPITIVPISAWSDIVPDEALNAVDQRLIKTDAMIKALSDIASDFEKEKADNLQLTTEEDDEGVEKSYLTLLSNGKEIGDKVELSSLGDKLIEDSPEGLVKMITI